MSSLIEESFLKTVADGRSVGSLADQITVRSGIFTDVAINGNLNGAPIGAYVLAYNPIALTNKTITDASNNVSANSLKTTGASVNVAAATPPTIGQILRATSATTAGWGTEAIALVDTTTFIVDATDPTKRLGFDVTGATATTATIQTTQVANRTYTIPDSGTSCSFVMTTGNQAVTGTKSFSNLIVGTVSEISPNVGVTIDNIRVRENTIAVPSVTLAEFGPVGAANDISVGLLCKGNGGIVLTAPNNAISGGNARGINAIDLQVSRNASTKIASGDYSATISGLNNTSAGAYSATIGGTNNTASGIGSVLAGGDGNTTNAALSGIFSGTNNTITSSQRAVIIGGASNHINPSSDGSTITGGINNTITGTNSIISTGTSNTILSGSDSSTICSGTSNNITATSSSIGSGTSNAIQSGSDSCAISSGSSNRITGSNSLIGAGTANIILAGSDSCSIGGGVSNTILATCAGILGGTGNTISAGANNSIICGGANNNCSGVDSVIAGGSANVIGAGGNYGGILSGQSNNLTSGLDSVICGGSGQTINASNSGIVFGSDCLVTGTYAVAGGRQAKAAHAGSHVYSDNNAVDFSSTNVNQWSARFTSGFKLMGASLSINDKTIIYVEVASYTTTLAISTMITIPIIPNTVYLVVAEIVAFRFGVPPATAVFKRSTKITTPTSAAITTATAFDSSQLIDSAIAGSDVYFRTSGVTVNGITSYILEVMGLGTAGGTTNFRGEVRVVKYTYP